MGVGGGLRPKGLGIQTYVLTYKEGGRESNSRVQTGGGRAQALAQALSLLALVVVGDEIVSGGASLPSWWVGNLEALCFPCCVLLVSGGLKKWACFCSPRLWLGTCQATLYTPYGVTVFPGLLFPLFPVGSPLYGARQIRIGTNFRWVEAAGSRTRVVLRLAHEAKRGTTTPGGRMGWSEILQERDNIGMVTDECSSLADNIRSFQRARKRGEDRSLDL